MTIKMIQGYKFDRQTALAVSSSLPTINGSNDNTATEYRFAYTAPARRLKRLAFEKMNPEQLAFGSWPPKGLQEALSNRNEETEILTRYRINPLRIHKLGLKREQTWATETRNANWDNNLRSELMQRAEFNKYHSTWRISMYGNKEQQETLNKLIRKTLKYQMDNVLQDRLETRRKVDPELAKALEHERQLIEKERLERMKHKFYLNTCFLNENKRIMEEDWQRQKLNKIQRWKQEREQMKLNPCNWSGTLK